MLENCAVERKQISVLKLSTITQSLEDDLLELRIDSINIEGSASKLAKLGETSTAEDVIDNAFRPRSEMPTPFPMGRFGDGSISVYYAAVEKRTCEQEILFRVIDELNEVPNHTRFYSLVECQYAGITTDLCGHVVNYPCLVSDTKQGYPFCQQLGFAAIEKGIEGLLAPSARQVGGTCVPVFSRPSLSGPYAKSTFKLLKTAKGFEFQQCDNEM